MSTDTGRGSDVEFLVVGAGVAGLAAAAELEALGRDVVVVDAEDAPGGVMRTDVVRRYVVERGPNTIQIKPPLKAFLDQRGLTSSLLEASPIGRNRYLVNDGRLEAVPLGLLPMVRSPLLSLGAKLRMLGEPLVSRGPGADESVDAFVSRRLGPEVSRNLVGAFLTGVYAGDERQLGADAVFPSLVEYERANGSILRGMLAASRASRRADVPPGLPGTWSCSTGLGALSDAIAGSLSRTPRLGTRVDWLGPGEGAWSATGRQAGAEGWHLRARHIVLATPAPVAASLLAPLDRELGELLAGIEYGPIVALALGVAQNDLARAVAGFGFLVPRHERRQLLGCLFMSQLFPGRAPAGHQLLHCMMGGTRSPELVDADEDDLLARACADLEDLLGLRGAPETLSVRRWRDAVPQPTSSHRARVAQIRSCCDGLPSLALAGSYLDGVAVADAAACGVRAAQSLAGC